MLRYFRCNKKSQDKMNLECLRKRPAKKIIMYIMKKFCMDRKALDLFLPVHGDIFLPENVGAAMDHGHLGHPKDLLIGTNEDEGSYPILLRSICPIDTRFMKSSSRKLDMITADKKIRMMIKDNFIAVSASNYYMTPLHHEGQKKNSTAIKVAVRDLMGDYVSVCPAIYFAMRYAELTPSANVYFYQFTLKPKKPFSKICKKSSWIGSNCHNDELIWLYGLPFRFPDKYSDSDRLLSIQTMKTWTHFSQTGEALAQHGVPWPQVERGAKDVNIMELNPLHTEVHVNKYPQCFSFWRPVLRFYQKIWSENWMSY